MSFLDARGASFEFRNLRNRIERRVRQLIYRQLRDVLTRAGLTPIEAEGKLFDPHYHEAVERVEAPGHREHEIVEELQRGYKLNHRLLRPAIVKVAVAPKQGGPSEKPASSRAGG